MDHASSREPLRIGDGWILRGARDDGVILSGALDKSTAKVLRGQLLDAVSAGTGVFTVDVRAVTLLDAGTVRVLLQVRDAAAESGRSMRLLCVSGVVSQLLTTCGIGLELVVCPAPDERGHERFAIAGPPTSNVPAEWRDAAWLASPPAPAVPAVAPVGARVRGTQRRRADDARVRSLRRALLTRFRTRLGTDPLALADERFLATADRFVVLRAIVVAALVVGGADRCVLQLYDPRTRSLRIAQQYGLSAHFVGYFATVDADGPSACATVAATGRPVLVDDVARSPVFAGRRSRDMLLAAGTRAVALYPLRDGDDRLLGVLCFHYSCPEPRHGNPDIVAYGAAMALAHA